MTCDPSAVSRRTLLRMASAPLLATAVPALAQAPVPTDSIGGIVGEIDRDRTPIPPSVTRTMTPQLLDYIPPATPGPLPFPGTFRAWLDRADGNYTEGDTAQVWVDSSVDAFAHVIGCSADGSPRWLFPPDFLPPSPALPAEGAALKPGIPVAIPQPSTHGFRIRITEPFGPAVAFIIVTVRPIPRAQRDRLRASMSAKDVQQSSDSMLGELENIAREDPELRLMHVGLPYVSAKLTAAAAPRPPGRALDWMQPTPDATNQLFLTTPRSSWAAGDRFELAIRTEQRAKILVLALGNGGLIDLLHPNTRQSNELPAGAELYLPPRSSDLLLRVRGPRLPAPETERLLVIARSPEAPPIPNLFDTAAPTATLRPGSDTFQQLETMLRISEAGRIVAELPYRVTPLLS